MSRIVRDGLVQATLSVSTELPIETIKQTMIGNHFRLLEQAATQHVQIFGLQELFSDHIFERNKKQNAVGSSIASRTVRQSGSRAKLRKRTRCCSSCQSMRPE